MTCHPPSILVIRLPSSLVVLESTSGEDRVLSARSTAAIGTLAARCRPLWDSLAYPSLSHLASRVIQTTRVSAGSAQIELSTIPASSFVKAIRKEATCRVEWKRAQRIDRKVQRLRGRHASTLKLLRHSLAGFQSAALTSACCYPSGDYPMQGKFAL